MAPLPVPIFQAGSGNIDGKNYIFGGGNPVFGSPGNNPTHGTRAQNKAKSNRNAPATTYDTTYIYDRQ